MADWITQKEKEGHRKVKTEFKKKAGPSQPSEDAAIYDMQANKSNKYGAVNRHLISKLRG